MTKTDQKKIIITVLLSVQMEILSKIEHDKIPTEWDGFELKQYCADILERNYAYALKGSRLREYRKTMFSTNL